MKNTTQVIFYIYILKLLKGDIFVFDVKKGYLKLHEFSLEKQVTLNTFRMAYLQHLGEIHRHKATFARKFSNCIIRWRGTRNTRAKRCYILSLLRQ